MEIVVSGWGRDHGKKVIARRELTEARSSSYNGYVRPEVYATTTEGKEPSPIGIRIIPNGIIELSFYARITLNGEYLVRQTMTRREIARLFFAQYQDCSFQELLDVIKEVRETELDRNFAPILLKRVNEVGLSDGAVAWLIKNKILHIGQLVQKTESEIRRLQGFEGYFVELRDRLLPLGLQFGMEVKGWPAFPPELFKKLDDLNISIRTANCFKNSDLIYVGDLMQKTEIELLRMPNFGRKSVAEIKEQLALLNLQLGMEFPHWRSTGR